MPWRAGGPSLCGKEVTLVGKAPADQLRAVLAAYRLVKNASWPRLHPGMEKRSAHWPFATEEELRAELEEYLNEACTRGNAVRVFWKVGPKYLFAGCNELFAKDAGLPASDLLGADDFDARLPWGGQAAKYRADDTEVVETRTPKLGILERQRSPSGTVTWVHVGKAPILSGSAAIGILGLYEILDDKTAQKLLQERRQAGKSPGP